MKFSLKCVFSLRLFIQKQFPCNNIVSVFQYRELVLKESETFRHLLSPVPPGRTSLSFCSRTNKFLATMNTGAGSTDPAPVENFPGNRSNRCKGKLNKWLLPGQKSPQINFILHRLEQFPGNSFSGSRSIDLAPVNKTCESY